MLSWHRTFRAYEPFIPAIFHDLPHSVADRSFRLNNRVLDAFIRFLSVSQTRLGWQSVLDVLTLEAVYPSFDLSSAGPGFDPPLD